MRYILILLGVYMEFLMGMSLNSVAFSAQWTIVRQGIGKVDGVYYYRQICFPDAQNGWVVSSIPRKEIIYTKDGGQTWNELSLGILWEFVRAETWPASIYFLNKNEGWIGTGGAVAHTTDGGKNWELLKVDFNWPIAPGAELNVDGIYFANSMEGWINCSIIEIRPGRSSVPLILHTTNGGKMWEPQFVPQPGVIDWGGEIQFINAKEGWAEMWYGPFFKESRILHTFSGGENWEPLPGTSYFDGGSFFLNSLEGWAVAEPRYRGFHIFHTEDGGKSWVGQSLSKEAAQKLSNKYGPGGLSAITFANSHFGWAVGENGVIVSTQDGGETWQLEESGVDLLLEDVQYVPGAVFILAEDGTILKKEENIVPVEQKGKLISIWGRIKVKN